MLRLQYSMYFYGLVDGEENAEAHHNEDDAEEMLVFEINCSDISALVCSLYVPKSLMKFGCVFEPNDK